VRSPAGIIAIATRIKVVTKSSRVSRSGSHYRENSIESERVGERIFVEIMAIETVVFPTGISLHVIFSRPFVELRVGVSARTRITDLAIAASNVESRARARTRCQSITIETRLRRFRRIVSRRAFLSAHLAPDLDIRKVSRMHRMPIGELAHARESERERERERKINGTSRQLSRLPRLVGPSLAIVFIRCPTVVPI